MPKNTQGTETQNAPEIPQPIYQRPLRTIERQGANTAPVTVRLPQIRGGVCEFCGIIDPSVPGQFQWKLCPHFRGIEELRCSYCDEAKNPVDTINHSNINVAGHPYDPSKWVVWCNSYECSKKHLERFNANK